MPSDPSVETDIGQFFKPYPRHLPRKTIPLKRSSSSAGEDDRNTITARDIKAPLKTPAKTVSFKNVTPSSIRTFVDPPFSPHSEASLPIRSPRPAKTVSQTPVREQRLLFQRKSPPRHREPPEISSSGSFTFADLSERSQSIVENGKVVAIRGSDDEDTDSLESLQDLFARKKSSDDVSTDLHDSHEDSEAERLRTLALFTNGRSERKANKDQLRALQAREKALSFDLAGILDDHLGDEKTDLLIKRARESDDEDGDGSTEVNKELLANIVRGADAEADDDDVSRLLNAVERTEALAGEKTYSFFNQAQAGFDETNDEEFPARAIPSQLWQPGDEEGRSRAFLSGIMVDKASADGVHETAMRWLFHKALRERQDDLSQSYVHALKAGSKTWTRLNLTSNDVSTAFRSLGSRLEDVKGTHVIKTKHQPLKDHTSQHPKRLLAVLEVFTSICQDMDMSAVGQLSSIALRLSLDCKVMSTNRASIAVETLIGTLLSLPNQISRSHIFEHIITDMTQNLQDPLLQCSLLSHILPTSPTANTLRKTLADIFLFGPSISSSNGNSRHATLDELSNLVKTSPSWRITRTSHEKAIDYTALTAQTSILDVAIGSGNPPDLSADRSTINQFNASVDTLASTIHTLFVSIKDAGASHMRRTEAKDALQALHFRLLYGVRIGVKKKTHVFDIVHETKGREKKEVWRARDEAEVREERKERGFMEKFLGKGGGITKVEA